MFSSKNNKGKHPTSKKVECFPILHTFSVSVLYKIPPPIVKVLIISALYSLNIFVYTMYIYTLVAKLIIFHRKIEGMY